MDKPDAPEEVRTRAKKDRKTWCKGKVGVKHDFAEPVEKNRLYTIAMMESVCTQCGKIVREYVKFKKNKA